MPQPTAFSPYRPGQGIYARGSAAAALLLLSAFGSTRLFWMLQTDQASAGFQLLGMQVPYAGLWAGAVFIVLAAVVFLFTFAPGTGWKKLDSKAYAMVDMLVDTEAELAKVSWPSKPDLTRSTTAVLVSIVLLGGFLLSIDLMIGRLMSLLNVLP